MCIDCFFVVAISRRAFAVEVVQWRGSAGGEVVILYKISVNIVLLLHQTRQRKLSMSTDGFTGGAAPHAVGVFDALYLYGHGAVQLASRIRRITRAPLPTFLCFDL